MRSGPCGLASVVLISLAIRISTPETSSLAADVEDVALSQMSDFLLSKIPITYGARSRRIPFFHFNGRH